MQSEYIMVPLEKKDAQKFVFQLPVLDTQFPKSCWDPGLGTLLALKDNDSDDLMCVRLQRSQISWSHLLEDKTSNNSPGRLPNVGFR